MTIKYSRQNLLDLSQTTASQKFPFNVDVMSVVLQSGFLLFPRVKEKEQLINMLDILEHNRKISRQESVELFEDVKEICEDDCLDGDDQLYSVVERISLGNVQMVKMEEVCLALEEVLHVEFPRCQLRRYGSSVTDLGFKDCDLDIYVDLGPEFSVGLLETRERETVGRRLTSRISAILRQSERFRSASPVLFCKVPIVRLKDRITKVNCDINIISMMGVANSSWLRFCADTDSRARAVILLFKLFTSRHGVSGSGKGDHLNGYTAVLMAVHFLQIKGLLYPLSRLQMVPEIDLVHLNEWNFSFCSNRERLPPLSCKTSLTELLSDLFRFYSTFSYSTEVICPLEGDTLLRYSVEHRVFLPPSLMVPSFLDCKEKERSKLWDKSLSVQDPFELTRNVAQAVSKSRLNLMVELCHHACNLMNRVRDEVEDIKLWMLFEPKLSTYYGLSPERKIGQQQRLL